MAERKDYMNHFYKIKDTIKHYEKKGITEVKICYGNPINRSISNEIEGLKIEDFYEVEIGSRQTKIVNKEDGTQVLILILVKAQFLQVYPDFLERLIDTPYYARKVQYYRMFDHTKSNTMPVGFCHLNSHRGLVSKNMMDGRNCANKNCPYFERFENHPYWMQKKQAKEYRRAKKENRIVTLQGKE